MLRKRGRIWHYEFEVDGVRHRGTTRQTDRAKARAVLERERARERDRAALGEPAARVSLADAATSWWTLRGAQLRSAPTIAQRLEICRRLIPFDLDVALVTTRIVADAMARRLGETTHNGRRPTSATVNRDLIDTLRPVIEHARRVLGVQATAIDWRSLRLREPKVRSREFTGAEIEAIRAALPAHHLDLFDFLSLYGCRLREPFVPLAQIDIDGGRMLLRQRKGGDWHSLPLTPEWRRRLGVRVGRARKAGIDTPWFWADGDELHALSPRAFQSYMRGVLRRLGIADARPAHDLRHHAGTQAVRRTGNLRAAQRLLGHESITSTARYAHAAEEDVLAALGAQKPSQPGPASPQVIDPKERETGT